MTNTQTTMKLNEVEPEGFCNEPFVLSREVKALRRDLNEVHQVLLELVELLQSPIEKEAA
jgi:hypothetical protein